MKILINQIIRQNILADYNVPAKYCPIKYTIFHNPICTKHPITIHQEMVPSFNPCLNHVMEFFYTKKKLLKQQGCYKQSIITDIMLFCSICKLNFL